MKLYLPKALMFALLVAMSTTFAVAETTTETTDHMHLATYNTSDETVNVGTMTGGNNFPSDSENCWTPGTESGDLVLAGDQWLGALDANKDKITSFGTQNWSYEWFKWKDSIGGTVSKNAQFNTLTIYDNAQVVLGGQYKSSTDKINLFSKAEYTGVVANKVVVNGNNGVTSLNTWNLTVGTLEVNSGNVNIHDKVQSGNNHFVYELSDSKQARIKEALNVNGGVTTININSLTANNNPNDTHVFTGFGTINFDAPSYEEGSIVDAESASIVKAWINQTAGDLTIQGKTASVGGLNINQTGGAMNVSTKGSEYHSWHILSDFGDCIIKQGGDAETTLNIGGIAAYNSKYSEIKALMENKGAVYDPANSSVSQGNQVMDLNASVTIEQTGSGEITIHKGIDLNNYHENSTGVASAQASSIKQTSNGTINLNGAYKGASFNVEQTGVGGTINLLSDASMTVNTVKIDGTLNVDGALQFSDFTDLNNVETVSNLTLSGTINVSTTGSLTLDNTMITIIIDDVEKFMQQTSQFLLAAAEETDTFINVANADSISAEGATFELLFTKDAVNEIRSSENLLLNLGLVSGVDATELTGAQITLGVADDAGITAEDLFGDTTYSFENLTSGAGASIGISESAVIPEPTTTTLSLLALVGLAARRRRR